MLCFFLNHILENFWQKFNNSLWISDFQNIIQIKLGLVTLEPILSPVFHLLLNLFWNGYLNSFTL